MVLNSKKIDIAFLYITYLLFLISALLQNRNSMLVGYVINILVLSLLIVNLLTKLNTIKKNLSLGQLMLIISTFLIVGVASIIRFDVYSFILFIKLALLIPFFATIQINISTFCRFINFTYLTYACISVLFFYNLLPFAIYERWDHPTMYVDFPFIHYYIFYGLEGGASYMDSYSGLVFLINIFLNKTPSRKYFIMLSAFFIAYTLKMTPLAGLIFCFATYLLIKKRYAGIIALLVGNILLVLTIYWLVNKAEPLGPDIPFWETVYAATHGRGMIWEQQVEIMLREYSIINYIIGGYSIELFSVPALQIWGQETGDYYDNPHNTYLLLFFRAPLLFVTFYLAFLYASYRRFEKKEFIVLLFICIICYTNSTIISLQNPVYIYTILYLLAANTKLKYNENTLSSPRV